MLHPAASSGSAASLLPREVLLGVDVDDDWRGQWDGQVGQKLMFAPPALAF